MSFQEYATDELAAMANARNYIRWIMEELEPHLGEEILEVGSGIGTFAEEFLKRKETRILMCVEPAKNLHSRLEATLGADPRAHLVRGMLEDVTENADMDSIVMINVLEHIEDDRKALQDARQRLKAGGKLLIYVPALPCLYGSLDRVLEHHRRYTKASLANLAEQAGFKVQTVRYANSLGMLSWFIAGRVLKRTTMDPRQVEVYDKYVIPAIRAFERIITPPIGQNLWLVAEN